MSPDNEAFSSFLRAKDLLYKDELLEQERGFRNFPPDVIIEAPNGRKFEFFRPGTVQEATQDLLFQKGTANLFRELGLVRTKK